MIPRLTIVCYTILDICSDFCYWKSLFKVTAAFIFRYCRRNTDCFPSPEGAGYPGHMTNTVTPPHLHHPPFTERGYGAMATANRNCFGSPGIKQEPRDYGYDIQKGKISTKKTKEQRISFRWLLGKIVTLSCTKLLYNRTSDISEIF